MDEKYSFFENVYEVARQIPYGRVTSYGAIAEYLGTKKSARMVGWAMSASFSLPDIPAHRVLNRKGMLTGAAAFPPDNPMKAQLEAEGVRVEDDTVVEWDTLFWHPKALDQEL